MACITAASLIAVYAGYMLFQVGWLGVFLTTAPFVASAGWWTLSHSKSGTTAALNVSADGALIFANQSDNYRVRPEPETFLAVLDNMSTEVVAA